MIQVLEQSKCCGCGACAQKCPKRCIEMREDKEGFLYPKVDAIHCINCGLCEKVCPFIDSNENKTYSHSFFAVQSKSDEIRLKSSSGGIFSLLAEKCISAGGVVFGARFDDNMFLIHSYTESFGNLDPFRGSKYIQSYIGDSFQKVERFLKEGRQVLFSGTPCQIKALKKFLMKDYDNLLTVDVICHGVPSPGVFRDYIKLLGKKSKVVEYNFRDKCTGWCGYSCSYMLANGTHKSQNHMLDYFFEGGLELHYFMRPSCFYCQAKGGKSLSDITLGDLWHIGLIPEIMNDDKGANLISINTEKGKQAIDCIDFKYLIPQSDSIVRKYNNSFFESTLEPNIEKRKLFWMDYSKNGFYAVINSCNNDLIPSRRKRKWIQLKASIKRILIK